MSHWTKLTLTLAAALTLTACGDGLLEVDGAPQTHDDQAVHAGHATAGEVQYWRTPSDAQAALSQDEAAVQPEAPFQTVGLMLTADSVDLEVRATKQGRVVADWQTLELDTHSGRFHNATLRISEPADTLHVRGEPTVDFARFEFFDDHHSLSFVDDADAHDEELPAVDAPDAHVGEDDDIVTRTSAIARSGRYQPSAEVRAAGQRQEDNFDYIGAGRRCSGTFLPGARRLGNFLVNTFRGAAYFQGYNCRTIRGGSGLSMHGTGRAIDVFIPKDRGMADNDLGDPVANYLIENATELGVQFIVWDRAKWNIEYGVDRYYGGAHPHHDHLHIELTPHAAQHLNNFPSASGGGNYALDLDISFRGAKNPFATGSSAAIADLYPGEVQRADILVTNKSNADLPNLVLGFWTQNPYVSVRNYRIYDDHPHHDRRTWKVNSADTDARNPARDQMGASGYLHMHRLSPGESKKVSVEIVAHKPSFGHVDHADLRVWVKHIDGIYGEQTGFFQTPTNGNAFGRNLRDYAEVDVLSRDHWDFMGETRGDVEGWWASGDVSDFKLNARDGVHALATKVSGPDPALVAPEGVRIDANSWDELVLKHRSHDGAHTKAIYWARAGESFSEERVVRVRSAGDSRWHSQPIRLGDHPRWSGTVTKLRVDIMEDKVPSAGDSGWYDLSKVYFQSTSDSRTTMPGESYR
jgi:hypothetical protein